MEEFLDIIAYKCDSDIPDDDGIIYRSRQDDSYITRVGLEDDGLLKFWKEHGINQLFSRGGDVASIGFSSIENKWYGWSRRAIYGFEVGSEVKKGDCGYVGATPEDLIDDHANFFADISQASADAHRAECQILGDRSGMRILHTPRMIPMASSMEDAVNSLDDDSAIDMPLVDITPDFTVVKCGRGEWVAKTMEDAKQMACDFSEGVS